MNDKPYYTISIDIGSTNTACSISSHKNAYPTLVSLNDLTTCERSRENSLIKGPLYFDETVFWNHYAIKHKIRTATSSFSHPIKRYLRNEGNLPTLPPDITIENLLTDYLGEINKCAKQIISGSLISKSTEIKNISPSSITYCITIPSSLWTESTMGLIRKAAIAAKLVESAYQRERLILMKESVATATFCRKEYEIVNKQSLKTGERFLVCDIGGKSMDVCVFEFTKLQDFMEVTRAQSGQFGTAFFDTRAKSLLKEKIGMEFDFFQEKAIEQMLASIYIQTMCKSDYDGEECVVNLPDSWKPSANSLRDVVDGKLTLTASELKETIYDPLFTSIFDLIRKQFELAENKIDTIFITGGLGQSLFVQNKIKKEFGTMVSSTFVPRNGVLSVSRGAIYSLTKKTKELVVYKKKEGNDEKKSYKVVMGIDFGTTFSGVAYSVINDYEQNHSKITEYLFDVTAWRNQPRGVYRMNKVPTVSAYKGDELKKWGYDTIRKQNIKDHKVIHKFKLYLNKEKNLPELPEGVSALKAISDYLHLLHDHAMKKLNKSTSLIFQPDDVRYCLTVPAMWTDQAKSAMRQAAVDAKLVSADDPQDRLVLVGEPEAAALYCEKKVEEYKLKDGDRFLICDAGGGTVDLVVYQIKIDNGKKALIEVSGGTGDICGGTYIDERMRYLYRRELEDLTESKVEITDSILDHCMTEFISTIKHSIKLENDDDEDIDFITLPNQFGTFNATNTVSKIEDCKLGIPVDVIRDQVYKPITDKIKALIKYQFEQSQEKLDAIFLVGGFGQSGYLLQSIRKEYDSKVDLICSPDQGEMAIVRGAVLMGLNPQSVTERVIRRTYGFSCGLPFEEGRDPTEHSYQSKANNTLYCRNRFLVYAKKDDIRSINHFVVREFVGSYGKQPVLRLYAYDGSTDDIPRYTFDDRVKKVAQFKIAWPDLGITDPEETIDYKVKFYLYQTEIMIEVDIRGHVRVYTSGYESEEQPLEEHGIQGENNIQYDEINEGSRENAIGYGTEKLKTSYTQTVAAAQTNQDVELSQEEYGIQGVVEEDIKG